jgi:predicted ATPase
MLISLRDVIYVSAARLPRLEAYPSPNTALLTHGDVGAEGEFAPWWYVQMADEQIDSERRHPTDERVTVRGQVDAWLNELFPGAASNAEAVSRTSLTRLDLRMGRGDEWRRPVNIGYGLSYAFPVLVALIVAKKGQLIIVDSPEAHLHPRAQSIMGRLLAHMASTGVQILVETHSDHILSGIRLGVRDQLIAAEDVVLHFFRGQDSEGSEVRIVSPRLDTRGSIELWPEGFFDQAEKDLSELAGWT